MPYKNEWVPAEVALDYNGVVIYHAYKNDDIDQPREYWFMLNAEDTVDDAFDVRDYVDKVPSGYLFREGKADVNVILREAIDTGLLRNED